MSFFYTFIGNSYGNMVVNNFPSVILFLKNVCMTHWEFNAIGQFNRHPVYRPTHVAFTICF